MDELEGTPAKRVRTESIHAATMPSNRPPIMPNISSHSSGRSGTSMPTANSLDPAFLQDLSVKHDALCNVLNLDADTKAKTGMVFKSFMDAIGPEDSPEHVPGRSFAVSNHELRQNHPQ